MVHVKIKWERHEHIDMEILSNEDLYLKTSQILTSKKYNFREKREGIERNPVI